jgi:hypothetical protein
VKEQFNSVYMPCTHPYPKCANRAKNDYILTIQ